MNLITDHSEWNALISALPHSHLLQSWEWGEFKSRYGWTPRRFAWIDSNGRVVAAAQILRRSLPNFQLPVSILYVPKGPLLAWEDETLRSRVLDDLQFLARRERAIFIKIDPDLPSPQPPEGSRAAAQSKDEPPERSRAAAQSKDEPPERSRAAAQSKEAIENAPADLRLRNWRFSPDQIQFRNTVTLDLRRTEAELLAGMKQKTRYNVRLAERRGVRIRLGDLADLDLLYRMYVETSARDGFVIRSADYYRDAWGSFIQAGLAQPLIAEVEGQVVSAVIMFKFAKTAWYMYGMSRQAHREKMPNHLLQWEAIRWAKAQGCATYDFWGAPDEFVETDPMWGVWKFKEGFGGQVTCHVGAWDYAPSPVLYWLYTVVMPRMLDVMRWRGKRKTQQTLE